VVLGCAPPPVAAQGSGSAVRDLPESYLAGAPLPVTIAVLPPPVVLVVGVEDQPPAGWQVSNITQSGSFDALSGKVKWGPFFSPSIPSAVSYDAASPAGTSGPSCFSGTGSFDGSNQPIRGDLCIPVGVPVVGEGGLALLSGLVAAAGVGVSILRGKRGGPDNSRS